MQQISLELAKFGQFAQSSIKNVDKQTFDELLKKLDKKTLIKIFGISIAGLSTFYLLYDASDILFFNLLNLITLTIIL
jgi:hypothetical protein